VPLDFGTVAAGDSAERSFTLGNAGGGTLSGTMVSSSPAFRVVGAAAYHLGPGQSRAFAIRFVPPAAGGTAQRARAPGSGRMSCVLRTGAAGCDSVACAGVVDLPPACRVSPDALDFGFVGRGASAMRTFTVTNVGGGVLADSVADSCGDFHVIGLTPYSLSAGESTMFGVIFVHRHRPPCGATLVTCSLATGGSGCPPVRLQCTVPAQGESCYVDPPRIDFGEVAVGDSIDRSFRMGGVSCGTVSGTVTSTCQEFHVVGDSSYVLTLGGSKPFTVRFAPRYSGFATCYVRTGQDGCPRVLATGTGRDP
jgi:hypothetical protein